MTTPLQTVPAVRRKLSWPKRCLFGTLVAVIGSGLCELASLAAIRFLTTAPISDFVGMRRELLRNESVTIVSEVIHPYMGWVIDPSSNQEITTSHGRIGVNDFGLLDNASPIHRRSPEKVIVGVIGGSVAMNVFAEGGPAVLQTLQNSDRFRGKTIQLVRLAMPGYKQPQQLMLMTYLLTLGAEFDLLVNLDGYNEVALHEAENAKAKTTPSFPRAWHGRVSVTFDPRSAETALTVMLIRRSRTSWARSLSWLPFQKSALVNFVWWSVDRRYHGRIVELNSQLISTKLQSESFAVTGPPSEFEDQAALHRHLVEYWANCSVELNRLCESRGIEYHHVLPPNQYLEGSKPMGLSERKAAYYAEEDYEYSRSAQLCYPLLVERGKSLVQAGVRFHDITQLFAKFEAPLYGDICCHYNEQGNVLVAEAVARIIARTPESR